MPGGLSEFGAGPDGTLECPQDPFDLPGMLDPVSGLSASGLVADHVRRAELGQVPAHGLSLGTLPRAERDAFAS